MAFKVWGGHGCWGRLTEAQQVLRVDAARQYLMKNSYDVVLARHDAGWEIEYVIVDNVWRTGDPGVLGDI